MFIIGMDSSGRRIRLITRQTITLTDSRWLIPNARLRLSCRLDDCGRVHRHGVRGAFACRLLGGLGVRSDAYGNARRTADGDLDAGPYFNANRADTDADASAYADWLYAATNRVSAEFESVGMRRG